MLIIGCDFHTRSGLAECFYRISTHIWQCTPRRNLKSPPIIVGRDNVSPGSGDCKDNPGRRATDECHA